MGSCTRGLFSTHQLTLVYTGSPLLRHRKRSSCIHHHAEYSRVSQRKEKYKMAAADIARPIEYDGQANETKKEQIRERKLHGNKDTLFYDRNADGRKYLVFFSTLTREWLNEMTQTYPELEEVQQAGTVTLQSEEGCITSSTTIKVVVTGGLMRNFDRDFTRMKRQALPHDLNAQMAGLNIGGTGGTACPFVSQKRKKREEELHSKKDILFDNTKGNRCNLIFYSTHVREWLDAMKQTYPRLEERQQDNIITLKDGRGTITCYPTIKAVVEGNLVERFESNFLQMRERVLEERRPRRLG